MIFQEANEKKKKRVSGRQKRRSGVFGAASGENLVAPTGFEPVFNG
jgi:hypothetical protein